MAVPKRQTLPLTQLVGMNTTDPAISLLPGQMRLIENVDLLQGGLGEKRPGFSTGPGGAQDPSGALNTEIVALFRHAPDGNDGTSELWAVARPIAVLTPRIYRYTAGAWTEMFFQGPDFPDWVNGDTWSFATFNRKLFIACRTVSGSQGGPGVNRLHVWDGISVRRAGLAPPAAAPGLANLGAGALTFTRWYRVRFHTSVGNPVVILESGAGPTATIAVAGSSGVAVTRPPLVDGNETVWIIEASNTANGPWFEIGRNLIASLIFNDTNATIPTTIPAPEAGLYTLPPSAKYLAVYQNQLIMAGAWETTSIAGQTVPKNNRVWYTRPLGSLEISDDESITTTLTQKFFVDTGEDNDRINGLSYPLNGICYVTKRRQFWALIPRDNDVSPFAAVRLTDSVGCRDFRTIVIGEDESGDPALYWNSLRGPYRMVRGGMQYLGRDLELNSQLSQVDRAVWVADRRQVWWTIADGGLFGFIFNVRFGRVDESSSVRNGWTQYDANTFSPRTPKALCVFGEAFGASSDRLLPVIGGRALSGNNESYLWQFDLTATGDVGNPYRGLMRSGQITLGNLFYNVSVYPPRIYGEPRFSNDTIPILWTLARNFQTTLDEVPQSSTTTLIRQFAQTRSIVAFEGIDQSDGEVFQFELGDPVASFAAWRLFACLIPYQRQEEAMSQ